ncbi:hypothetical protein RF11_09024 [Thelohanellus kitauei]|uniref:Uncharacterized protein n=1 Tax=Thelohanellus kitauei TaxID=669202 RepID=A0A0C2IWK1_THEKT|nr:hypothetical protein RF11_09024 [Thelohanellus kitauei]
MADEVYKLLKRLINSKQAQTKALIRSQKEQISEILCKISRMKTKCSLVHAFEGFDVSKEHFVIYIAESMIITSRTMKEIKDVDHDSTMNSTRFRKENRLRVEIMQAVHDNPFEA